MITSQRVMSSSHRNSLINTTIQKGAHLECPFLINYIDFALRIVFLAIVHGAQTARIGHTQYTK